MQFLVALDCAISVIDPIDEASSSRDAVIEEHLDAVMEELLHLGAGDPSIELDLTTGSVGFSVVVTASNPVGAAAAASGLVRTAIHAAGGATPDWPGSTDEAWSLELLGLRSERVVDPPDSGAQADELVSTEPLVS